MWFVRSARIMVFRYTFCSHIPFKTLSTYTKAMP